MIDTLLSIEELEQAFDNYMLSSGAERLPICYDAYIFGQLILADLGRNGLSFVTFSELEKRCALESVVAIATATKPLYRKDPEIIPETLDQVVANIAWGYFESIITGARLCVDKQQSTYSACRVKFLAEPLLDTAFECARKELSFDEFVHNQYADVNTIIDESLRNAEFIEFFEALR